MAIDPLPRNEKATYTIDELIAEFVQTPEDIRVFERTGWIDRIMRQLIDARCDSGLTQAQLGERMGKQQSAIARLERGDDLKLSTLFDYLWALDLVPADELSTERRSELLEVSAESDAASENDVDFAVRKHLAAD